PVERLKQEKTPLGMLAELPALIAAGYENVPEEDLVRLKWWGLYHDKPKVGTFMLRIKLPGGRVSPEGLRAIGEISNRFGRDLGAFVPKDEAVDVLRVLLDAWKEDLRYRVSRVKSRMKFMVDDYGADGIRAEIERRLGRPLTDFQLTPPGRIADHIGVHPQKQAGLYYVGVPAHLGLMSGDQMLAVADLAERLDGDVRLTRQQNFVVTGVPEAEVDAAVDELTEIGFPLDVNHVRAASIACTGEPHCNF